ncbi:MAG: hypothetical protein DCF20_10830 [Pseudanabaena sp.]|nr:MAG: hypothetical protein DCF20_10830 [Pseudanabaena sp.]
MRVLLLWQYYDRYLHYFYQRYPDVELLPYEQHQNKLISDNFIWTFALILRLRESGYEVEIAIVNDENLQRKWAVEKGKDFNRDWQFSIPYQQIQNFHPDIIWSGCPFNYYGRFFREIKPFCKLLFTWISCPWSNQLDFSGIDCVLTSDIALQAAFEKLGVSSQVLLPAFEPRILKQLENHSLIRDIPLSFVGGLSSGHRSRKEMLNKLAKLYQIQIWGYRFKQPVSGLRSLLNRIKGEIEDYRLDTHHNGEVWGMEMYRILQRSFLTIDIVIDMDIGMAGSMRMFEATGLGTLLLTYDAPNMPDLFASDCEVATYRTGNELIDKIKYYLEHKEEGEKIASAGQKRTLTEHNTLKRSRELMNIFESF